MSSSASIPSASIEEISASSSTSEAQPPAIPASVLSSLVNPSASSRKARPPVRTLDEAGGQSALVDSEGKNNVGIYCPRLGCGCLMLRKGDAVWKEGESGLYDASGPFPPAPSPSSSTTPYWLVSNSPFGFENAGFSRNIPPSIKSSKADVKLKYLICADCDLGPLGWSTEGGKEAWVAVERVAYGQ